MAEWRKTVYHFLAPSGHPTDRHQDMSARLIWQGFKETTSVHGIPHVDRAPGTVSAHLNVFLLSRSQAVVGTQYFFPSISLSVILPPVTEETHCLGLQGEWPLSYAIVSSVLPSMFLPDRAGDFISLFSGFVFQIQC